jgi:hypothetical protein
MFGQQFDRNDHFAREWRGTCCSSHDVASECDRWCPAPTDSTSQLSLQDYTTWRHGTAQLLKATMLGALLPSCSISKSPSGKASLAAPSRPCERERRRCLLAHDADALLHDGSFGRVRASVGAAYGIRGRQRLSSTSSSSVEERGHGGARDAGVDAPCNRDGVQEM